MLNVLEAVAPEFTFRRQCQVGTVLGLRTTCIMIETIL